MNESSSSIALKLLLDATSNPKSNLEQNIHEYVEGLKKQIFRGTSLNEEDRGYLEKLLGINNMQSKGIIGILFLLLFIIGPVLGAILGTIVWIILCFYDKPQYSLVLEYTIVGLNFCFLIAVAKYDISRCNIQLYSVAENTILTKLPLVGKLFKAGEGEITGKADIFALEKARKKNKSIDTISLDDL